jgi:amino acid transporter
MMHSTPAPARRTLTLLPLIAVTYFVVSGGPYGLEELVEKAGYTNAIAILLLTPLLWSLPTVLMLAELTSALPEDGGYYTWVRRAMGPFWGFQEAWLSLAASIFDMAIYPTLFALYLGRLWPALGGERAAIVLGCAVIAASVVWNLRGARAVGDGSVLMMAALLAPFVALVVCALVRASPPAAGPVAALQKTDLLGGILIAMWNYMGWDNASTIAGEVDRPERTYPRAMFAAVALVAFTYVVPVAATARAGVAAQDWSTGAWVDVAGALGGPALAVAVAAGGMICGLGLFNANLLSYSRLPVALAEDGYLPRALARRDPRTGAPRVSLVACAIAWALALGLGFERLVELDVLLLGLSLLLEFAALVVLRVREPALARPFRVPGGLLGAVAVGVGPLVLLAVTLVRERSDAWSMHLLALSAGLVLAGPVLYFAGRRFFGKPN